MARKKKLDTLHPGEKAALLYGQGNWHFHGIPRLGIEDVEVHDGPFGLVRFKDESTVGDAKSEPSVCFPGPCALASSFDEELVTEVGKTMGRICRDAGTHLLLAPGINIKRNPLCGRNFEYYSEDPLVAGKLGAAFVSGIQSQGVGACLKHFACNNQEGHRMINDSIVDQRALHEIYLKPFEIAVKEGHPWSIMSSYNKINGVYASDNDYLLKDILKGEWKFDGVVMSDWGGTNDYILSHNHGLDIEMPGPYSRQIQLKRAMSTGVLAKEAVDDSVERIVKLLNRCHSKVRYEHCRESEAHELSIKAATESCVLLKNEGILPLRSLKQTCIIGELARTPNFQGGGSSKLTPIHVNTFLGSAITWNGETSTFFAPGYRLDGKPDDEKLAIDAVDLASRGGRVILFMGLDHTDESEGYDRADLHLPEEQISLFNQIYEVNQNIIVVLNVGAPVELPFKDKAKAILLTYLPGEGGGEAIYRILLGKASPSGHLAETWPRRAYDVPSFGFYPGAEAVSLYRESIYVGYRYYLSSGKEVNYPFGHGLSYAKFKYGAPAISAKKIGKGELLDVAVEVENVSLISGKALVQIYQEPPKQNVFKPLRTLIAFKKVALEPGERKTVHLEIRYEDFAHYDIAESCWKVEAGEYAIQLCDDCTAVRSQVKLNVLSDDVCPSLRARCPVYYHLPEDGFLSYDNDFEELLGHTIPVERDRSNRPFNRNSTIENTRYTLVGKTIIKAFRKRFTGEGGVRKDMERFLYEMPLRNLSMGGLRPKMIQAVIDAANGHYLRAIWHFFVPVRRK
ncbi:MAG: glycoside hydrolase family 3 protein [Bacilli bacterium]|nr:glycoside hydrolase family 3 protein [Bacilli bacterium]